jgi:hypothetical protein
VSGVAPGSGQACLQLGAHMWQRPPLWYYLLPAVHSSTASSCDGCVGRGSLTPRIQHLVQGHACGCSSFKLCLGFPCCCVVACPVLACQVVRPGLVVHTWAPTWADSMRAECWRRPHLGLFSFVFCKECNTCGADWCLLPGCVHTPKHACNCTPPCTRLSPGAPVGCCCRRCTALQPCLGHHIGTCKLIDSFCSRRRRNCNAKAGWPKRLPQLCMAHTWLVTCAHRVPAYSADSSAFAASHQPQRTVPSCHICLPHWFGYPVDARCS